MKRVFISFLSLLVSACGTVFSGTQQNVTINTNVSGTKVFVNGMPICSTPCAIDLKRNQSNTIITVKKNGYEDATVVLSSQINPVSIINLSSIYSWTTDFLSGGVWRYSPDAVYIEMEKLQMTTAERRQAEKAAEIRRFILFNFAFLKAEKEEYLNSLRHLTGLDKQKIIKLVRSCHDEITAADQMISAAG